VYGCLVACILLAFDRMVAVKKDEISQRGRRMVRQSTVDMKRLWELAEEGKDAQEIMKELNISDMATLKNALQNLVDQKGKSVNVPGLIGKGSVNQSYTDSGVRVPPGMSRDKS